jgi:fatty-acyl-CoA synthase
MKTLTAGGNRSSSEAWLRALERTGPIPAQPERIFSTVIQELAERAGSMPALLSDSECFTYDCLAGRSNRYARWALDQELLKGDAVCLLMPNRPEYIAIWLGITAVGGIVSLLNTHLSGASLAHCINSAAPKHIIVAAEFLDSFATALPKIAGTPEVWVHGALHDKFSSIDRKIERYSGKPLSQAERRVVTIHDPALYIYTSGTTGLPKAAKVSHFRLMQWSHWFAGLMDAGTTDRMYNCLPMYHSVGGVLAIGAVLVGGGSVVVREKFSASQFWTDIVRWDCTLVQYIGELCRYLLHAKAGADEVRHRIRIFCGNGLRPEIWEDFKTRFRIPQILEFYAATEGNFSLFNVEGKPGAIGRVPSFLAYRFTARLVKFDFQRQEPLRNDEGFCVPCTPNEVGEAIGKVVGSNIGSRFEGYTSKEASDQKILRNVFEPGDSWFRTGDLMRQDEKGYFYFIDRVGDTFRWKGENVSTSEVAEALCTFPGIQEANVYGVAIPGSDGRAGMAAIIAEAELDLSGLRMHLSERLPHYARPVFLRVRSKLEVTATFKHTKRDLMRDGYDPNTTAEVIFFYDAERDAFVLLGQALFDRIQGGQITL